MSSEPKKYTEDQIKEKLNCALGKLYDKDHELFIINANERSITHKLAEYLQAEFPDEHVDCEYNRNDDKHKKLFKQRVFPDIVVHKRRSRENFLVIEVKKDIGSSDDKDLDKLKLFMKIPAYKYDYAIFLRLGKSGVVVAKEFSSMLNKFEDRSSSFQDSIKIGRTGV